MKKLACKKVGVLGAGIVFACTALAGTVTDNFNASRNYLTQGLAGTIWEGLYTGAGQVPGGTTGGGPGSTILLDANITGSNSLTVASTQTDWEYAGTGGGDDGVFLFKLV